MIKLKNKDIIEFLKRKDINILGFATIKDIIPLIPDVLSPKKKLKDANSAICYAIPIPKGVLYSDYNNKLQFWRYSNISYRNLDNVSNFLSLFLEEHGYISTPINSSFPMKIINREYWGYLPLVYLAEQAGLGKITKCGLLGNPKYGTRILLGGVFTSKNFKKSEIIQQEICPTDCFECINNCPFNAIDQTGKVNHSLCMRKANINPIMTHLIKEKELTKSIDFETILNTVGVEDHAIYICFNCLHTCPLNIKFK